ncbi:hypothetical protein DFH29DRAFT_993985 [Suillus ampliporus]|nr:hypothetical protein DFH29DRAFT_993985 [Suillus ampliporus]
MSSQQLNVLEQYASSTNDRCLHHSTLGNAPIDQDSTLQLCLELLDRHCDRLNSAYKEILDIRIRITEILTSCQSEVVTGNVGAWDSSIDLQAFFGDEPQTITPIALNKLDAISLLPLPPDLSLLSQPLPFQHLQGQLSDQEYGPPSQERTEITNALSEGVDLPTGQLSQDLLPSDCADYELGTHPFQKFILPCTEGQTLSDPSTSRQQQLYLPVVRDSEEKVKCMWSGCSSVVKNYTRHVNEIHLRQFRAICASCGKAFQRPYMKKNHICRGRHSKRSSS